MNSNEHSRKIRRVRHFQVDGEWQRQEAEDDVSVEEPLEIRVEGKAIAVIMRTPGNDEELVAGFLVTEGVISKAGDIFELSQCPSTTSGSGNTRETGNDGAGDLEITGNAIDVILTDPASSGRLDALTRHVFSSSSCGICGKATIDSIVTQFPRIKKPVPIDPGQIVSLPGKLRSGQSAFDLTGGLHACGLFSAERGSLEVLREDVGRHNAVDKALGHLLLQNKLPASDLILLVSGRISFEIMQKALAAGIPVVAGISAPTSLAIDFARESGQHLIGFLRDGRFNCYTG